MPTRWTLDTADPRKLKNHLKNIELYGTAEIDKDVLESVKTNGVLEPIRITKDGTILSGHRRRQHAIVAKLTEVPILRCRSDLSDAEQVIQIVESNRQREKTVEQRTREYTALKEAYAVLAAAREKAGLKRGTVPAGGIVPQRENLEENAQNGRSADQAAADVGMDRKTAEKAAEVVAVADSLQAAGEPEKAAELIETLNTESVSAAHRAAKEVTDDESEEKPVLDEFKVAVSARMRNTFSRRSEFRSLLQKLGKLTTEIQELQQTPSGKMLPMQEIEQHLSAAQTAIKFAVPYTECPACRRKKDEKCKMCRGLMWITEPTWTRSRTKEMEEWILNR